MILNLSILFIFFSIIFLKDFKNQNVTLSMFLILFISLSLKIMLINFEINGSFINQFTIRDEVTFLRSEYIGTISPGDNFFVSFLFFFRSIYDDDLFIKFLPVFFSIIYFYYLIKIINNLNYDYYYKLLILIISLISPAYLLFNYSITKEFLQGVFLLPSIYYSLKIIDSFKLINVSKLMIFLILFSYTHRGFEVISILILLSSIFFYFIKQYKFFFKKNWLFIIIIIFTLSIMFYYVIVNSPVGKNFVGNDFVTWLNNIRQSDPDANNTYKVSLKSDSFIDIITTLLLTVYYYFFFVQNLSSLKHIYYFFDLIFCSILLIVFIYSSFNKKINNSNFHKHFFILIIFFAMSFGFAIFTYNTGNAIRHKSVTNVLIYLYLPLFLNLVSSGIDRSLKIFK